MQSTGYPYLDRMRAMNSRPNVSSRPQSQGPQSQGPQSQGPQPQRPQNQNTSNQSQSNNNLCDIICRAWRSRNQNILVPEVAKQDLQIIMKEIDKKAVKMSGNQNAAYEEIIKECPQCGLPDAIDMQGNLSVSFKSGGQQTLQGPVINGQTSQLSTYNFGGRVDELLGNRGTKKAYEAGLVSAGTYVAGLISVGLLFFVVGYSLELGEKKA